MFLVTNGKGGNLTQEPEHLEEDENMGRRLIPIIAMFCAAQKLFTLFGGWAPQEII